MSPSADLPVRVERLPSKHSDEASPAHHVGSPPTSFRNPWPSFGINGRLSLYQIFRDRRRNRNYVPIPTDREQLVKVQKPDWGAGKAGLKATWLGHASFLVEAPKDNDKAFEGDSSRGVRILFDPVFSERVSPVSFLGPKRFTPTPCTLDTLPEVDLVVISHNHYDHLDLTTICHIWAQRKEHVHFFAPLGNKAWFTSLGINSDNVTELDWWEGVQIDVQGIGRVNLTCTPSQHGSGRSVCDQMSTLWSSWVVEAPDTEAEDSTTEEPLRLFFAGDTGYRHVPDGASEEDQPHCPAFAEIGTHFNGFNLSLLPIGCYLPRHLLSPVHCNADDAACMHRDLKSQKSIGMHWGTVRGGISQYFEPVTEPPLKWREACEKRGYVWGKEVGLIDVGETISVTL